MDWQIYKYRPGQFLKMTDMSHLTIVLRDMWMNENLRHVLKCLCLFNLGKQCPLYNTTFSSSCFSNEWEEIPCISTFMIDWTYLCLLTVTCYKPVNTLGIWRGLFSLYNIKFYHRSWKKFRALKKVQRSATFHLFIKVLLLHSKLLLTFHIEGDVICFSSHKICFVIYFCSYVDTLPL